MITVKLKIIDRGGQTLPISVHEMAPMRAFSVSQKWPKIVKMTPNDLLTLKMVSTEPLRKTEQNALLVSQNSFFVDLEQKQIPR